MHTIQTAALCGCLVIFAGVRAEEKSGKLDAKSLKGTYTIVKGEKEGKPLPADHFKGAVVTFTGKKIYGHDKAKKEFFSATYTIDTSSSPATIKMMGTSPKKENADGVIETDGSTVRICYALPGGETPKSFKTAVKQQCFTLKRIKDSR